VFACHYKFEEIMAVLENKYLPILREKLQPPHAQVYRFLVLALAFVALQSLLPTSSDGVTEPLNLVYIISIQPV
jgi:hypothetical protein